MGIRGSTIAAGWRGRVGAFAVGLVAAIGLLAAPAGAAAEAIVVSPQTINPVEGQSFTGTVATFTDSPGAAVASDYSVTINWGDGTTTPATASGSGVGPWTVSGTHTYAEEGSYALTVSVTDTASSTTDSAQETVVAADAPLSVPGGVVSARFAGTGSSGASAPAAVAAFVAAIGGGNNGTTPSEQVGGFRDITWDNIALDGSDPGSTVIPSGGHVVAISTNRLQDQGIELSRSVAVANDGFASVNGNVVGRFPAFTAPNLFGLFNTKNIQMQVIAPTNQSSSPTGQATRGLGVMFSNVRESNTTCIQYMNGTTVLDSECAPVAGEGQLSFVGALFPSPVVTSVVLTLGTARIFNFDGTTATPGTADNPPAGDNLVAGDDVILAEPAPTQSTVPAMAGVPFSGAVDTFVDTDPSSTASDYRALIDWGDSTNSAGTIAAGPSGGYMVLGSHTYLRAGTYTVQTTVTDFGGSTQSGHLTVVVGNRSSATSVSCSPSPVAATHPATCTATVSDASPGTAIGPTGSVMFSTPTNGGSFSADGGCTLGKPSGGRASCTVMYTSQQFPPRKAKVTAVYGGDVAHDGSHATASFSVRAQGCVLKIPSARVRRHPIRIRVIVTCDSRADVMISATAVTGRRAPRHGPRFTFGRLHTIISGGRATSVYIKATKSASAKLLTAVARHQRIALSFSVTASIVTKKTTSTAGLRTLKGV